jgi:hypothetical protein
MDDPTSPSFIWGLFVRELFETSVRPPLAYDAFPFLMLG